MNRYNDDPDMLSDRRICKSRIGMILGEEYADDIEASCFAKLERTMADDIYRLNKNTHRRVYASICARVMANGDFNGDICSRLPPNRWIYNRLRNGELDPRELGSMEESEMYAEINAERRRIIEERSNQKIEEKVTNLVYCSNCKRNNIYVWKEQKRCGDEGVTYMYKCKDCSKQWSERS